MSSNPDGLQDNCLDFLTSLVYPSTMGWIHESDTHIHEAWLHPVFGDGALGKGSTMVDGVDYEIVGFGSHSSDDELRPSAEIVGWVLECDCYRSDGPQSRASWRDPVPWSRVPSRSLEDLSGHRVFATDSEASYVADRPDVEEAAKLVWQRDHLDPADVDDAIRRAAAARRKADADLDAAVVRARRQGRSWAEIGAAAGMSRQSAHERWKGHRDPGTPASGAARAGDASGPS